VKRVSVLLTLDGVKELILEGDTAIFDDEVPLEERRLSSLGFWISRWQHCTGGDKGGYHKGRVFIPWSSALYVESLEDERNERFDT
jgi:hypothetical protein